MRLRIAFTPSAKRELDSLVVHIARENPKAAVQVYERIVERIELLRDHPEIERKGRVHSTRELVVTGTQYVAIYRVDTQRRTVQIVRIKHAAQM